MSTPDGPDVPVTSRYLEYLPAVLWGSDTAGGFTEMTLRGTTDDGREATVELMVPSSMVRMIVSTQQDGGFGFRPRPG